MNYGAKNFIIKLNMKLLVGLPIVDLYINNQKYKFMLDTGAFSIVSSKIVKTIDLMPLDKKLHTIDSLGVKSILKTYSLSSFSIENVEFKDLIVAYSDFFESFPVSCMNLDGIIGYNFLQNLIVKLDYKNSEITISDSLKKEKGYQKTKMKFDMDYGPKFNIDFGFMNTWIAIDTGKNDGILLGDLNVGLEFKKHEFKSRKHEGIFSSSLSGVNKNGYKETFIVKNFKIAKKITVNSYPISIDESTNMLVGNGFLKHFETIIDFKSKHVYFKNIQNSEVNEGFSDTFGFFLYWNEDNKVFISSIIQNTPASHGKLQIGDRILSLNGEDMFEYKREDYCKYFLSYISSYEKKNKIELVIKRDNKIKKIILVKNT